MKREHRLREARIVRHAAPVHVREAVHAILTGAMAAHLLAHRVQLTSEEACRGALIEAGFGENSVATLLPRVIASANTTGASV